MSCRYSFETVLSWLDRNYPEPGTAGQLTYADMVSERVLRDAIRDFPESQEPARHLAERLMRRCAFEEALEVCAARLSSDPADEHAFVGRLKALLRLGRIVDAREAYEAATPALQRRACSEDCANQFLQALIESGAFDEHDLDFEDIFFASAFVKRTGSIMNVSRLFANRYLYAYLALAKTFVEASGGRFVYVSVDNLFDVENKSGTECELLAEAIWERMDARDGWLKSRPTHLDNLYAGVDEYSQDYVEGVFSGPGHILQSTRIVLPDYATKYVNISNNRRVTTDAPETATSSIHVFGGSDVYGFGVDDARTIPSFLQRVMNASAKNAFRVENHGLRGSPLPVCMANLFQTAINEGDVVILFGYPKLAELPSELGDLETEHISFSRPHDYGEIFLDHSHVAVEGNSIIAKKLAHLVMREQPPTLQYTAGNGELGSHRSIEFIKYLIYRNAADVAESGGLKEYVDTVRKIGKRGDGAYGSVAVNCNPMTLGHLHLLEYAARSVDHLYVFVIEEDISFFSFADRLKMVELGLGHLSNVTVLPGGRYICTQLTFPEYASKDEGCNVRADASMEAWFFCEYIAKELNIKKIFLGNEPTCIVTRQYNSKMAEILPQYGIEVDIIPRISVGEEVVSASTVRRLLQEKDFDAIGRIVPPTTHQYLLENYG